MEGIAEYPEMDYFMNESKSDVMFVIDGKRLPALKALLSVKNQVFNGMFSSPKQESKYEEIEIKDTTFDAFKTLIEFLYCDRLVLKDGNDFKLIREVCKVANKYRAKRLMKKISDHLKTIELTLENMGTISDIAMDFRFESVFDSVLEYLYRNFDQLVNKDHKKLVEMNDSTHNLLLKVFEKKYRNVSRELNSILRQTNRLYNYRCNHCQSDNYLPLIRDLTRTYCKSCRKNLLRSQRRSFL